MSNLPQDALVAPPWVKPDPDSSIPPFVKKLIMEHFGITNHLMTYSQTLGHPANEIAINMCGQVYRVDSKSDERKALLKGATMISTIDCPNPNLFGIYDPRACKYASIVEKVQDKIQIEEDHHDRRKPFNPSKTNGYDLILPELGCASTISILQLRKFLADYKADVPVTRLAPIIGS